MCQDQLGYRYYLPIRITNVYRLSLPVNSQQCLVQFIGMLKPCLALRVVLVAWVLSYVDGLASNLRMSVSGRALVLDGSDSSIGRIPMGMDIAKSLRVSNPELDITVLRDLSCGSGECRSGEIPSGVSVVQSPKELMASGLRECVDSSFDFLIDNWSSSVEKAAKTIELGKDCKADHIVHLSPAMDLYTPTEINPITEDSSVNSECDASNVEAVFTGSDAPVTVIRWQYVHGGEKSPLLEYLIERIARDMHIPLPLHGEQLLSMTHISDLAGLVSSCLGETAAKKQIFNCGGERYLTYQGLCNMVKESLGTSEDLKYLYFEPKLFNVPTDSVAYPFGRSTSLLSTSKAQSNLDWKPSYDLERGLKEEVSSILRNRDTAGTPDPREFMKDMEIIASKDVEFTFDYPFL